LSTFTFIALALELTTRHAIESPFLHALSATSVCFFGHTNSESDSQSFALPALHDA
jgi:hypothetical protein